MNMNKTASVSTSTVSTNSVGTKKPVVVTNPTYVPTTICKWCGEYASAHWNKGYSLNNEGSTRFDFRSKSFIPNCPRDRFEIGTATEQFEGPDGHLVSVDTDENYFPLEDNGYEQGDDKYDPWFVEYDASQDPERIDAHRDLNPDEHTWATNWKYIDPNGNVKAGVYKESNWQRTPQGIAADTSQRNVYVEGQEGFLSIELYDEAKTEMFQYKLLNVYRDKKTKHRRVGGMEFTNQADGSINARCANYRCHIKPLNSGAQLRYALEHTPVPFSIEHSLRQEMEAFTIAVIRHGNNHAADWFTERNTYYKVHTATCQLDCNPDEAVCVAGTRKVPFEKILNTLVLDKPVLTTS